MTYEISTVDRSRSKIRGSAAHFPIQLTTCFGPGCPKLIMSPEKNVGVNGRANRKEGSIIIHSTLSRNYMKRAEST